MFSDPETTDAQLFGLSFLMVWFAWQRSDRMEMPGTVFSTPRWVLGDPERHMMPACC